MSLIHFSLGWGNESNSSISHDPLKLEDGDLLLRAIDSSFKKCFHAGIYTGNKEVIEFTGKK